MVLVIAPMTWTWWMLERHMDFSPFGSGVAFTSPLFEGVSESFIKPLSS